MTQEEMTNLGAGRDLDGLIIGFLKFEIHSVDSMGYWVYVDPKENPSLFKPSENIRDAWIVVDKMRTEHKQFITIIDNPHLNYDVRFSGSKSSEYHRLSNLPLAICRAALLAVLEATP